MFSETKLISRFRVVSLIFAVMRLIFLWVPISALGMNLFKTFAHLFIAFMMGLAFLRASEAIKSSHSLSWKEWLYLYRKQCIFDIFLRGLTEMIIGLSILETSAFVASRLIP